MAVAWWNACPIVSDTGTRIDSDPIRAKKPDGRYLSDQIGAQKPRSRFDYRYAPRKYRTSMVIHRNNHNCCRQKIENARVMG